MATATFDDLYFGQTAMRLESFRTAHRGARVSRYRWMPVPGARGCITTGFLAHGFPSREAAIQAAERHVRFSAIQAEG